MHPAFESMLAASRVLGWPLRFQRDLTHHDRLWLDRHPQLTFLWAIRADGTHLYTPDFSDEAGNTAEDMVTSLAQLDPDTRFYGWDGVALQAFASADVAREWIDVQLTDAVHP